LKKVFVALNQAVCKIADRQKGAGHKLAAYSLPPIKMRKKKVLIVEDYAHVRTIMKILVHRYGYEVIEARDGYEAIEKQNRIILT